MSRVLIVLPSIVVLLFAGCADDSPSLPQTGIDSGDADAVTDTTGVEDAQQDVDDAIDSVESDSAQDVEPNDTVAADVDAADDDLNSDPDAPDVSDSDANTPDTSDVSEVDTPVTVGARVLVNEVNCEGADFIELFNAGDEPGNLTGWVVNDDVDVESGWALPAETVLEPGEWVVWYRDEAEGVAGFPFGVKCGAGEDTIRLFDATGTEVDSWELASLPYGGAVHGRLPDGGAWGLAAATPGAANMPFEIPDVDAWFDITVIRRLEITIPESSIANLAVEPRTWTPATLLLPDEEIGPLEVGIRLKGQLGSFRTLDGKAAFRVDLNRYVAGQTLYGLDELTLNNMVQDPSVIHEFSAYWIFREMGIAAPRVTWVQVTVNGTDYGLYLSVEGLNLPMLSRWYESTSHLYEGAYGQDLFVGDTGGLEVDEGSETDRSDVLVLASLLETEGIAGFYDATTDLIDWDQVVRMLATEIWIGHWDGYAPYRNNYYFHFDGAGRFTLLPWGTDQTFGDYLKILRGEGLVFQACIANDTCRLDYAAALRDVSGLVAAGDLVTVVERQAEFLRDAFIADTRREYDLATHDAVVGETLNFLRNRAESINVELDCYFGPNPDPDGDGFLCDDDCAPDNGEIYPGALDSCGDGIDQDCNGYPDDDLSCPDCVSVTISTGSYLFCPTPRNFDQALAHCAANGAAPVRITSEAENLAVWEAAVAVRYQWWWLALDDRLEEGVFRYPDGSAESLFFWADGQPDNAGDFENCAHFFGTERWNDIFCDATMGVICEMPE